MRFRELTVKAKNLIKSAGMKGLIAICAVLVLGCAIALNFILNGAVDDKKGKPLAIDLSADNQGDNLQVGEVENYFSSITLQRKQARDEAMEVLMTLSESETAIGEAKQAAIDDINKMALQIEKEANIETLVISKGFSQCVAVINDDKCNVIVETTGLMPGEVAQISVIVYEQAGILPENLKIIEKGE